VVVAVLRAPAGDPVGVGCGGVLPVRVRGDRAGHGGLGLARMGGIARAAEQVTGLSTA